MNTQTRTGSGCESGSDTCGLSTWRHHTSRRRTGQPGTWRHGTWRCGRLIATVAVLCALVMALHAHVPNGYGSPGSLLQTLLPWTGRSAAVLLVLAVLRRSALPASSSSTAASSRPSSRPWPWSSPSPLSPPSR